MMIMHHRSLPRHPAGQISSSHPVLRFACLTLQTTFAALFWVKSPSLVCSTFTGQVNSNKIYLVLPSLAGTKLIFTSTSCSCTISTPGILSSASAVYTPVILADISGSGSCTPGIFTLVSLIFSTCSLALRILKYKTPVESLLALPLHPAWLMEVCSAPYQQRRTWLPNHQHYTCCNNLTVIAAPPGLLSSPQASKWTRYMPHLGRYKYTTTVPMDILQERLKCLLFIISRLNLTWLNTLCLFLLTTMS
jgi:hypothetical protein